MAGDAGERRVRQNGPGFRPDERIPRRADAGGPGRADHGGAFPGQGTQGCAAVH